MRDFDYAIEFADAAIFFQCPRAAARRCHQSSPLSVALRRHAMVRHKRLLPRHVAASAAMPSSRLPPAMPRTPPITTFYGEIVSALPACCRRASETSRMDQKIIQCTTRSPFDAILAHGTTAHDVIFRFFATAVTADYADVAHAMLKISSYLAEMSDIIRALFLSP